ncbi:MAG TPA: lipid-A-disaccharide synthase [Bauldia sp.]|nr:lipid-A-disaccharide synthase [Bauldia sp.]
MTVPGRPFTAFLIAGEESGDALGAGLMEALSRRVGGDIRFLGVGGARMERLGLRSIFPMRDINHVGGTAIIANLNLILSRMRQAAREIVRADPDVYVMIDCPGFNLGVARRVRKWRPSIPIVDYVSPTVWAWRPRRSPWMAGFVDHVLAILPFEPEVHRRLGGPPCTYVGHPLIEKLDRLRPAPGERKPLATIDRPNLIVLPGSRHGEINRLLDVFGETVARLVGDRGPMNVLLPAVPRFADEIRARTAAWPVKPKIIEGESEKYVAFRSGHLALAASGTVTLELALSGVPMVIAYRVDPLAKLVKHIVLRRLNSFVLPNLITGTNDIPEFLDAGTTPERLAAALEPLLSATPERERQLRSFAALDGLMALDHGTPSGRAADIVLETARYRAVLPSQAG